MARFRSRRSVVIAIIVVALSLGLVFSLLPYLQPPQVPRATISQTYFHTVGSSMSQGPGNFGLRLPQVTATEPFAVNVTVVGGLASFCVILDQTYSSFGYAYNSSSPYQFPSNDCIYGPTGQVSTQVLDFALTPGTWDVVTLNNNAFPITAYYSPVPFHT